jgi:hypothetical protein
MVMNKFRIEVIVKEDGSIDVAGLPFAPGVRVEVVVTDAEQTSDLRYPLRGVPYAYEDPFGPASDESEWEAAR